MVSVQTIGSLEPVRKGWKISEGSKYLLAKNFLVTVIKIAIMDKVLIM